MAHKASPGSSTAEASTKPGEQASPQIATIDSPGTRRVQIKGPTGVLRRGSAPGARIAGSAVPKGLGAEVHTVHAEVHSMLSRVNGLEHKVEGMQQQLGAVDGKVELMQQQLEQILGILQRPAFPERRTSLADGGALAAQV
eukprot:264787-Prymnesium_polylepis.1